MRFVLSRFASRASAEAAVGRLVHAGFARDDISVSRVDEPRWRDVDEDDALRTSGSGVALRILASLACTLVVGCASRLGVSSLGASHDPHGPNVAFAIAGLLALVLSQPLTRLIATKCAARLTGTSGDSGATVVGLRVTESMTRHASRILERSGADHVTTE